MHWAAQKAELCQQQGQETERWRSEADVGLVMTHLGQRILDRLDHYEQHAKDYAEDSYRLSWSDHPNDRDRYLDFSRAQAWGFIAQSYALLSEKGKVKVLLQFS